MLRTALFLFSILAALPSVAQRLTARQTVYDCGQVMFRQPVQGQFTVRNKSSRTATIERVETSCGCTTAQAAQSSLAGGKEMTVSATYDAKQLGHFQKDIFIYEEGQRQPLVLTIKGVVVTEIKDYSGTYPHLIGQIRADRSEVEFDDVNQGETPVQTIHIFNTTGRAVEPVVMHLPDYLAAEVSPTRIMPNHGGEIHLMLLSSRLRGMGLTQTSLFLGQFPGDKVSPEKELPFSAVVIPSFADVTDYTQSPQLMLSDTIMSREKMSGKPEKMKGEIQLQNIGRAELAISALQMFTPGLQVSLGKTRLAPGEMTKLKIQADDTVLRQQKTRPCILMITNDPRRAKVIITVSGD